MKTLLLILGLFPLFSIAQFEGIKFESNLSWKEIIAKAKKENKYIFVDCYTTWCAPCKYMMQKIFTQSLVGNLFNSNFINISLQMDRTAKDQVDIRARYALADSINAKYPISAYPTYLIFSPDGDAVDRFIGSFEVNDFIARAKESLKPEKQYYKIIKNCKNHLGDSAFIRSALSMALQYNDGLNAASIADAYFVSIRDSFSSDNIKLLSRVNFASSDKLFQFFMRNASKIDEIIGGSKNFVIENRLCLYVRDQEISPLIKSSKVGIDFFKVLQHFQDKYPLLANFLPFWVDGCFKHFIGISIDAELQKRDTLEVNWNAITQKIRVHYTGFNCVRIVDEKKPSYYASKKMWSKCEKAALALFDRYGDQLDANGINNIAWYYLFMYSNNPVALKVALNWSRRSIEMAPTASDYMDTYANLLYKTGDRQKALSWEKKALNLGGSADIRSNYEKMIRGAKTWPKLDR